MYLKTIRLDGFYFSVERSYSFNLEASQLLGLFRSGQFDAGVELTHARVEEIFDENVRDLRDQDLVVFHAIAEFLSQSSKSLHMISKFAWLEHTYL